MKPVQRPATRVILCVIGSGALSYGFAKRVLQPLILAWLDDLGFRAWNARFVVALPLVLVATLLGAWLLGRVLLLVGLLSREEARSFPFVSRET